MSTPSATAPDGQAHTATPWHVAIDDQGNGTQRVMIRAPHVAGGDEDIAVMLRVVNQSKHANASHIVHCVNSHSHLLAQNAELLGALKAFTAAANSWHNFHHGSTMIQCDLLCECIVAGEEAITNASKVSP